MLCARYNTSETDNHSWVDGIPASVISGVFDFSVTRTIAWRLLRTSCAGPLKTFWVGGVVISTP